MTFEQAKAHRDALEAVRAPIPDLEPHCGSWVICRADTGAAVVELFDRVNVERLARLAKPGAVEILTAAQYLGRINAALRAERQSLINANGQ